MAEARIFNILVQTTALAPDFFYPADCSRNLRALEPCPDFDDLLHYRQGFFPKQPDEMFGIPTPSVDDGIRNTPPAA
jgi:hypothetical protein